MLQKLFVSNYLLIDKIEVDFSDSFNVITGETGAGKSILLGAINLILGDRADFSKIKGKSIIEATCKIASTEKKWFETNDLDYDELCIIRRELSESGRSRAFINDTPVSLSILKDFSQRHFDIHGQFENQILNSEKQQLKMLDEFGGHNNLVQEYKHNFSLFQKTKSEITSLEKSIAEAFKEKDYNTFLLNEIESANIQENERLDSLEASLAQQEGVEEGKTLVGELMNDLQAENGLQDRLLYWQNRVSKQLSNHQSLNSILADLEDRLSELLNESEAYLDSEELDEEALKAMRERIDLLNELLHKNRLSSLDELLDLKTELEGKVFGVEKEQEKLEELKALAKSYENACFDLAKKLSSKRVEVKQVLEKEVQTCLSKVAMPNALVKIELTKTDELQEAGIDKVNWLIKTNKSLPFSSIKDTASGGEKSRVLLAFKSALAQKLSLATMILDEADSGVSGEVANKIGALLKEVAQSTQIIAITHLPQVAAMAKYHLKVEKQDLGDSEETRLTVLNSEQRQQEIAEMIAGVNPNEMAINQAKEMLS